MDQMTEYVLAKTGECHNNIRRQISAHIFVPTIVYLLLILIWPTNVLIESLVGNSNSKFAFFVVKGLLLAFLTKGFFSLFEIDR